MIKMIFIRRWYLLTVICTNLFTDHLNKYMR